MASNFDRRGFLAAIAAAAGAPNLKVTLDAAVQSAAAPSQTFVAGLVAGAPRPPGAPPVVPGAGGAGRGGAPQTDAARVEAFLRGCDDCARLGVHNVEKATPADPLVDTYKDRLNDFKEEMTKRHLRLIGLANYCHADRTDQRQAMIDQHLKVARFIHANNGRYITSVLAPTEASASGDEAAFRKLDFKAMAANMNEIGKRVTGETGIEFGYHPEEGDSRAGLVDALMENTKPEYLRFWPDIGWMTMAGMDAL